MKRLFFLITLLGILFCGRLDAYEFTPCRSFIPVPEYQDRAGWDALTGGSRKSIVRFAEQYLGRDWKAGPNSNKHREALSNLVIGELAEGKGRFIPDIAEALTAVCERGYLSNNAADADVPSGKKKIALMEAAYGSEIAFAWHYFHDALPPAVSEAVQQCLKENIFDPFLDDARASEMSWIAENFRPGGNQYLNNWVPYCNTHVMAAFLLAECDQSRLNKAMERSRRSMERYLDYCASDGSCEEGPAYWNMAGAKVYEYVKMMYEASEGNVNILNDPIIRAMGEWRIYPFAGDGLVVNFSDSGIREISYAEMFFRIGRDCGSQALIDFAVLSSIKPDYSGFRGPSFRGGAEGNRIQRALENLLIRDEFRKAQKRALDDACGDYKLLYDTYLGRIPSKWYLDNQQAFLRNGKNFLFVKGGHNNEAHNHLDVGTLVYFTDRMPCIIDPGLNHDTYKALHEGNKYKVWSARSEWHSLPIVNGCQQAHGREHRAECFEASEKGVSMDISAAYPSDAGCCKWMRTYKFDKTGLVVTDEYELKSRNAPDTLNFIVWQEPAIESKYVKINCRSFDGLRNKTLRLKYPSGMKAEKERMILENKDQKKAWGNEIWRISFISSEKSPAKGKYEFVLY